MFKNIYFVDIIIVLVSLHSKETILSLLLFVSVNSELTLHFLIMLQKTKEMQYRSDILSNKGSGAMFFFVFLFVFIFIELWVSTY